MKQLAPLTLSLCLLGHLLCLPAAAQDDEIVWCRFDGPPLYIFNGPLAGKGLGDKLLKRMPVLLPGYRHTTISGNLARTLSLLQKSENACCATLIRHPERDGFITYSRVVGWVLPNRLLVLSRRAARIEPWLTADGLDLARLIESDRITIGIIKKRAYGQVIDDILAASKGKDCLQVVPKSVLGTRMLFGERFDSLLAYAWEAAYFKKSNGNTEDFTSIPIVGETLQPVYFGCSGTPFGQQAIKEIDRLLDNGLYREYMQRYTEWVDRSAREQLLKIADERR